MNKHLNRTAHPSTKALCGLSAIIFCASHSLAADDKAAPKAQPQSQPQAAAIAQPAAPTPPVVAKPVAPTAPSVAKSSTAATPKSGPPTDQDMAEALIQKINKGSGDIVLRSSDLPAPYPPKPEVKPEQKVAAKPETKPEAKPTAAAKPVVTPPPPAPEIPWTYADGPGGPENWANLKKENHLCSKGKMQSPININFDNAVKADLTPVVFEYRPFFLSIMDNGRTVEIIGAEGNTIFFNEKQYRLMSLDFHKPSEEAFNGERFEMSVHLVHQHFDGSQVIVAVMLSSSPKLFEAAKKSRWDTPPKESAVFQIVLNNVPLVKNQVVSPPNVAINPNQFLPENRSYFTYIGSLTEPPCTEGVTWIVMKNPVLVSAQQVHSFGQIYSNNARPLQMRGDRVIKESR